LVDISILFRAGYARIVQVKGNEQRTNNNTQNTTQKGATRTPQQNRD